MLRVLCCLLVSNVCVVPFWFQIYGLHNTRRNRISELVRPYRKIIRQPYSSSKSTFIVLASSFHVQLVPQRTAITAKGHGGPPLARRSSPPLTPPSPPTPAARAVAVRRPVRRYVVSNSLRRRSNLVLSNRNEEVCLHFDRRSGPPLRPEIDPPSAAAHARAVSDVHSRLVPTRRNLSRMHFFSPTPTDALELFFNANNPRNNSSNSTPFLTPTPLFSFLLL
jgi:hypothetical protein